MNLTAAEAIAQGLSRDGGLLTPASFPKLTGEMLKDLCRKDYAGRAAAV